MVRFLLICTLLTLTGVLMAGPWPRPQGTVYLKLYEYWLRFDEHYTDDGQLDPNITTGIYNTSIYAEYGLTDRITAVGNLPFFSRNVVNNEVSGTTGEILLEGESLNSIGDAELGLRYALTRPGSRFPVAVGLTLGLPLGEAGAGEAGVLQTGDGEFNQLLELSTGTSFSLGSLPGFAQVRGGVNNRTNGFSDELRFGLEAGLNVANERLWLIGRMTGVNSFMNGETVATNPNSTSIFANNAEYLSVGGELNLRLSRRLGLSVGADTAVSGSIIAAGTSYTVGVTWETR